MYLENWRVKMVAVILAGVVCSHCGNLDGDPSASSEAVRAAMSRSTDGGCDEEAGPCPEIYWTGWAPCDGGTKAIDDEAVPVANDMKILYYTPESPITSAEVIDVLANDDIEYCTEQTPVMTIEPEDGNARVVRHQGVPKIEYLPPKDPYSLTPWTPMQDDSGEVWVDQYQYSLSCGKQTYRATLAIVLVQREMDPSKTYGICTWDVSLSFWSAGCFYGGGWGRIQATRTSMPADVPAAYNTFYRINGDGYAHCGGLHAGHQIVGQSFSGVHAPCCSPFVSKGNKIGVAYMGGQCTIFGIPIGGNFIAYDFPHNDDHGDKKWHFFRGPFGVSGSVGISFGAAYGVTISTVTISGEKGPYCGTWHVDCKTGPDTSTCVFDEEDHDGYLHESDCLDARWDTCFHGYDMSCVNPPGNCVRRWGEDLSDGQYQDESSCLAAFNARCLYNSCDYEAGKCVVTLGEGNTDECTHSTPDQLGSAEYSDTCKWCRDWCVGVEPWWLGCCWDLDGTMEGDNCQPGNQDDACGDGPDDLCEDCNGGTCNNQGECEHCQDSCEGCCDGPTPDDCVLPGTWDSACGLNGAECVNCGGGECQNGNCTECEDTCTGCCGATSVSPYEACWTAEEIDDDHCGLNGATCMNCFSWEHCQDGECVDNEEPDGGVDGGVEDGGSQETDGGSSETDGGTPDEPSSCPNGCYPWSDSCCTESNPCNWDSDGYCDCDGTFDWNSDDCSNCEGCGDGSGGGGATSCPFGCYGWSDYCCTSGNPCNWDSDGYCDCYNSFDWNSVDCSNCEGC